MQTKPKINQEIKAVQKKGAQGKVQEIPHPEEERRLNCRECKKNSHENLLGCPNFKKYLPGEPNSASSLPTEIWRLCLGTLFNECNHSSMHNNQRYHCNTYDNFFLVCHKFKKHENAQEWMRGNHKPERGQGNLQAMFISLVTDHLQVNSVTMEPETQKEEEFGMADIVELDQDKKDDGPIADTSKEANVNIIRVNKISNTSTNREWHIPNIHYLWYGTIGFTMQLRDRSNSCGYKKRQQESNHKNN